MSDIQTTEPSENELIKRIIECAQDKKADNPLALDLTNIDGPASYFVICSGQSNPQLRAITDAIIEGCKESYGIQADGKDGSRESGWLILDYGSVLVHVLATEQRARYALEDLWHDAKPMPA
ncbi:MAG: ribosome silencing factor [Verrucomicrobiota bacterium]